MEFSLKSPFNQQKLSITEQYSIGKTLGSGTFGKVKLAKNLLTNELVAIKILEKCKMIDPDDGKRVTREIKILQTISHPNIIKLHQIIETDKVVYLIMEHASKGELFDYIVSKSKLTEKEACKFFHQIISGLEYLHSKGVSHRDLKPENLLLDQKLNLKIIDFGLSNMYEENALLKTACGSPCYAAPEMIAGKYYQPLRADIWSSGIVLFAMACGYLPFEDPSTSELYKKILSGYFEIPNFISVPLRQLMRQILNVNPEKRYGISEIRNHLWWKLYTDDYKLILQKTEKEDMNSQIISQIQKLRISDKQTLREAKNRQVSKLSQSIDKPVIQEANSPISSVQNAQKQNKLDLSRKIQLYIADKIQKQKTGEKSESNTNNPQPIITQLNTNHNQTKINTSIASNIQQFRNRQNKIKIPQENNNSRITQIDNFNYCLCPNCKQQNQTNNKLCEHCSITQSVILQGSQKTKIMKSCEKNNENSYSLTTKHNNQYNQQINYTSQAKRAGNFSEIMNEFSQFNQNQSNCSDRQVSEKNKKKQFISKKIELKNHKQLTETSFNYKHKTHLHNNSKQQKFDFKQLNQHKVEKPYLTNRHTESSANGNKNQTNLITTLDGIQTTINRTNINQKLINLNKKFHFNTGNYDSVDLKYEKGLINQSEIQNQIKKQQYNKQNVTLSGQQNWKPTSPSQRSKLRSSHLKKKSENTKNNESFQNSYLLNNSAFWQKNSKQQYLQQINEKFFKFDSTNNQQKQQLIRQNQLLLQSPKNKTFAQTNNK